MAYDIHIELQGLRETQKKMEQVLEDLSGPPMLEAMRDATLRVQRDAKENAPVDTGRLQASIWPEVRVAEGELQGIVGSTLEYAPYMEFGTGVFAEKPLWAYGAAAMGVGKVRHFPPWTEDRAPGLVRWARLHGFPNAFLVARAIGRRGGLEPRRYLRNAFENNREHILKRIENAVAMIVRK